MAIINFPSSPSNGDTFEGGGKIYQYNSTKGYWEVVSFEAFPIGYTGSQGIIGYTGSQGVIGYTGSRGATGFTGSQGVIGYTGSQGVIGYTGSQGFTGSQGNQGGLRYNFSTTTTDADPGTGIFRFNNATIGSVTQIYIDEVDQGSVNFATYIDSWDDSNNTAKGFITVNSNLNNDATFAVFRLNSITTATGYRKLNVTYLSGTIPSNGEACVINFSRSGDLGYTGSKGDVGFTGSQGVIGFTGSLGYTGSQGIQGGNITNSETAPANPVPGQLWFNTSEGTIAIWYDDGDSGQWLITSGPSGPLGYTGSRGDVGLITETASTAPSNPIDGQMWFDTENGTLNVYYQDGVSGQWIAVSGPTGPIGYTGSAGLDGANGAVGFTGSQGGIQNTYAVALLFG